MRVLVVDNYDSFVYNLVQYLAQLGASAWSGATTWSPVRVDDVDGVLISPVRARRSGRAPASR